MEDNAIVDLYWDRSEEAISQSAVKYGGYCYSIAYNILTSNEDAEESVSDTWLAAWNAMPPRRPSVLATFLGKLTRHLSIDRWRERHAAKRGGGEMVLALEELAGCVSGSGTPEDALRQKELRRCLNRFLAALPDAERQVFLGRYWYLDSVSQVAEHMDFSESKVKSMLLRIRGRLRAELEKEGLL
ncbi:MAG: sigma-70 family RNA polymerase sigma factor [Eubacteriales bacterium]|nr:sigma-70 family RNA polymerase sigma factor [Eubacteriales bacterium]